MAKNVKNRDFQLNFAPSRTCQSNHIMMPIAPMKLNWIGWCESRINMVQEDRHFLNFIRWTFFRKMFNDFFHEKEHFMVIFQERELNKMLKNCKFSLCACELDESSILHIWTLNTNSSLIHRKKIIFGRLSKIQDPILGGQQMWPQTPHFVPNFAKNVQISQYLCLFSPPRA